MGEELSDRMQERPEEKRPTAEDIQIITQFLKSDTERFAALNEQMEARQQPAYEQDSPVQRYDQPNLRIVPRPEER